MLLFTCPHCHEVLKVPEAYLGKRGHCNKCGGRIAVIGDAQVRTPQTASAVAEEPVAEEEPCKPATERQLAYLRELGAAEAQLRDIDLKQASGLIDRLKAQRQEGESATEKQLAYLRHLGAPASQLVQVKTKGEASRLIEEMHLLPTREQLDYLKDLGATGAQLAALKRKAEASDLIDRLKADGLDLGDAGHG